MRNDAFPRVALYSESKDFWRICHQKSKEEEGHSATYHITKFKRPDPNPRNEEYFLIRSKDITKEVLDPPNLEDIMPLGSTKEEAEKRCYEIAKNCGRELADLESVLFVELDKEGKVIP